jgi:hypothetical protein
MEDGVTGYASSVTCWLQPRRAMPPEDFYFTDEPRARMAAPRQEPTNYGSGRQTRRFRAGSERAIICQSTIG